jgi:hypothetical protein
MGDDAGTGDRALGSYITIVLEHADPRLSDAHRELYPERLPERVPFSITLLYPWIPRDSLTDADLDGLRSFFAGRPPLEFDLVRLDEFPGQVVFLVPEPDTELREMMRALWARYPDFPPYGQPGSDPPPHASIGRLFGEHAISLQVARARVESLLPVRCVVSEATLMEEEAPDLMRARASLPFGR